jgi:hypothetical protein
MAGQGADHGISDRPEQGADRGIDGRHAQHETPGKPQPLRLGLPHRLLLAGLPGDVTGNH